MHVLVSELKSKSSAVFDLELNVLKEGNSLLTINNSMVISQSEVPNEREAMLLGSNMLNISCKRGY